MDTAIAQMILRSYRPPTGYNEEACIHEMIALGFRIGYEMAISETYSIKTTKYWR